LVDAGFKNLEIGQLRDTRKLPPLGPNLTPFRTANPDFLFLIIAGFTVLPEGYILHTFRKKVKLL
jgi:hypothetical protein